MEEKFLTVFAVFDDNTQQKLGFLQNKILESGLKGSQTMDIPFHISLGSFSKNNRQNLIKKIKELSTQIYTFKILLNKINNFNNKVLFIEPVLNNELKILQKNFDNNFADGFPWHAHSTIFIDNEDNFYKAKSILESNFSKFEADIVGIHMGEFFPTNMIIKKNFRQTDKI